MRIRVLAWLRSWEEAQAPGEPFWVMTFMKGFSGTRVSWQWEPRNTIKLQHTKNFTQKIYWGETQSAGCLWTVRDTTEGWEKVGGGGFLQGSWSMCSELMEKYRASSASIVWLLMLSHWSEISKSWDLQVKPGPGCFSLDLDPGLEVKSVARSSFFPWTCFPTIVTPHYSLGPSHFFWAPSSHLFTLLLLCIFSLLFHVYRCFVCMYICIICMPCAYGSQKRLSDPLKIEL